MSVIVRPSPVTVTENSAGTQGPQGADSGISYGSVAALRALGSAPAAGTRVDTRGYAANGDGGEGVWYWDNTSTDADNTGTVVKITAVTTGRWKRIRQLGENRVEWFGALTANSAADNTAAWALAHAQALSEGGYLTMGRGTFAFTAGSVALQTDAELQHATFTVSGTAGVGFQVGVSAVNAAADNTKRIWARLPKVTQLGQGTAAGVWGSDIGVKIVNVQDSYIWCRDVSSFGTGVRVSAQGGTALSGSTVDNQIFLPILNNCKVGVELNPEDVPGIVPP